MTENCIARTGDLHFCPLPGHGVTPIVTGEPWVTVAGQSVACTDDETGCGAALIGSAGFFQINGRPVVRRGDSSSHAGVVVDGAEFFVIADKTGLFLHAGLGSGQLSPPEQFVVDHWEDAKKIATQLNTTPTIILGIAAAESGWGKSDTAKDNNFFGLHAPQRYQVDWRWNRPQGGKGTIKLPIFATFYDSGRAFAEGNGRHIQGETDPLKVGTILQEKGRFGIDTSTGSNVPTYAAFIAGRIGDVGRRVSKLGLQ